MAIGPWMAIFSLHHSSAFSQQRIHFDILWFPLAQFLHLNMTLWEIATCFLLCSIPKSLSLAVQQSHSLIAFFNSPRMSSNVLCFQICNSIEGDFLLNFVACKFHKKNPARLRICICWFSCPSGLVLLCKMLDSMSFGHPFILPFDESIAPKWLTTPPLLSKCNSYACWSE